MSVDFFPIKGSFGDKYTGCVNIFLRVFEVLLDTLNCFQIFKKSKFQILIFAGIGIRNPGFKASEEARELCDDYFYIAYFSFELTLLES